MSDDTRTHRSVINGVQVESPQRLPELIEEHDISQLLLALPSIDQDRRRHRTAVKPTCAEMGQNSQGLGIVALNEPRASRNRTAAG